LAWDSLAEGGGRRLTACFAHPVHQCVEEGVLVYVIVFHLQFNLIEPVTRASQCRRSSLRKILFNAFEWSLTATEDTDDLLYRCNWESSVLRKTPGQQWSGVGFVPIAFRARYCIGAGVKISAISLKDCIGDYIKPSKTTPKICDYLRCLDRMPMDLESIDPN